MVASDTTHSSGIFLQFGKDMASVIGGTVTGYVLVQLISISIMERKIHYLIDEKALMYLFSYQMIPTFLVFAILIASVYYLYQRTRKAMLLLSEAEISREREKAAVEATQSVTAMMIGYVSLYNAEIKDWIEKKREKGEQPPVRVERAHDKISHAMETMSEVSYLLPYVNTGASSLENYRSALEQRLRMITDGTPGDSLMTRDSTVRQSSISSFPGPVQDL